MKNRSVLFCMILWLALLAGACSLTGCAGQDEKNHGNQSPVSETIQRVNQEPSAENTPKGVETIIKEFVEEYGCSASCVSGNRLLLVSDGSDAANMLLCNIPTGEILGRNKVTDMGVINAIQMTDNDIIISSDSTEYLFGYDLDIRKTIPHIAICALCGTEADAFCVSPDTGKIYYACEGIDDEGLYDALYETDLDLSCSKELFLWRVGEDVPNQIHGFTGIRCFDGGKKLAFTGFYYAGTEPGTKGEHCYGAIDLTNQSVCNYMRAERLMKMVPVQAGCLFFAEPGGSDGKAGQNMTNFISNNTKHRSMRLDRGRESGMVYCSDDMQYLCTDIDGKTDQDHTLIVYQDNGTEMKRWHIDRYVETVLILPEQKEIIAVEMEDGRYTVQIMEIGG